MAIYAQLQVSQDDKHEAKLTVRIVRTNVVHLDDVSALDAALERPAARESHPVDRMSVGPRASDVALQTDGLDHDGVVHGTWPIVSEST
jgi:hypothetical protein